MPGLDYLSNDDRKSEGTVTAIAGMPAIESQRRGVYYNPRLDPKNYLEGPLSSNPSTRLRQMLARPGIVVSTDTFLMGTRSESRLHFQKGCSRYLRWHQRTMCSRSRLYLLVSKVWISKKKTLFMFLTWHSFLSGAATTASRLGQPDLAIATMNDFVQVCSLIFF